MVNLPAAAGRKLLPIGQSKLCHRLIQEDFAKNTNSFEPEGLYGRAGSQPQAECFTSPAQLVWTALQPLGLPWHAESQSQVAGYLLQSALSDLLPPQESHHQACLTAAHSPRCLATTTTRFGSHKLREKLFLAVLICIACMPIENCQTKASYQEVSHQTAVCTDCVGVLGSVEVHEHEGERTSVFAWGVLGSIE